MIRVATALADREASSTSVSRSNNSAGVWLFAAASRASLSNSRPIVGRRSCLNWVLSSSIVTSAIGKVLLEKSEEMGRSGVEHADRAVIDPAQELVEPAQVGQRHIDRHR